uniref:Sulfurtransferase n=1 Tax=Parastrongyloides trichosuri TaxID=131310 RepID=A0A0N4ZL64_PARTI
MIFKRFLSINKIISPQTLKKIIDKKTEGVKLLDCTYSFGEKPDYETFMAKEYGEFDILMKKSSINKDNYISKHIPTSIFFDLDCGLYPGHTKRFSFYPKRTFQEYPKKLGINNDDHLIVYSRGSLHGNSFAGRTFRLFQMYGHENISLLTGGLSQWELLKFPLASGWEKIDSKGDWYGVDRSDIIVTYEELDKEDYKGENVFKKAGKTVTFLDARNEEEFKNLHIKGANSFPVANLVNSDGSFKDKGEIFEMIKHKNINIENPIITYCLTGNFASLLSVILENVLSLPNRTFNGGFYEMLLRDPSKLSSKK